VSFQHLLAGSLNFGADLADCDQVRVLVADDDPIQRALLGEALAEWGYEVACVADGARAFQALQDESRFDVLVTDWVMPRLDGIDVCRKIREQKREQYLPIILVTSRDRQEDLIEGLNSGADALLTKPFDPAQLLAQLHVVERILKIENRLAAQLNDLKLAHDRLEQDLAAAATVQSSLLPDVSPKIHGVEFEWAYEACDRLGGDMFNIFRLDERRVGMYVLDVSGHGTSAALQSVSLSHALTPYDQQGGILKVVNSNTGHYGVVSPAEVARKLNRRYRLIEKSGQFFSFLYGILDVETRVVRYVRAGHPGPIVSSGADARCYEKGGGIPIGIMPEAEYADEVIQLSAGDRLIFYTDGVLEARGRRGEAFGIDRLLRCLTDSPGGIHQSIRALRARLADFSVDQPRRDDVTIVGLEIS
jgi:sigma-B regulation protein RsbU (phosphoserine phosphatase)